MQTTVRLQAQRRKKDFRTPLRLPTNPTCARTSWQLVPFSQAITLLAIVGALLSIPSCAESLVLNKNEELRGKVGEWIQNKQQTRIKYGPIGLWDTSRVTTMKSLFRDADGFDEDLSAWNVSAVHDLSFMFFGASAFTSDLSLWSVSQATDLSWMFNGAKSFQGNLGSWDISNALTIKAMFGQAFAFSSDLNAWNVSGTDVGLMFHGAQEFTSDLNAWDISGTADLSHMFEYASKFNSDLSAWDFSGVRSTNYMFSGAWAFASDVNTWQMSGVTDMAHMFASAWEFTSALSAWDITGAHSMSGMFSGATKFSSDLDVWDVQLASTETVAMFFLTPLELLRDGADLPCWFTGSTCPFPIVFNGTRTHLDRSEGVTTVNPTEMSATNMYRVGTTYRIAPLKIRAKSGHTYNLIDAPNGFYINPNTGVVLATFNPGDITSEQLDGDPLNVTLQVIADTGNRRSSVEKYTMHIKDRKEFQLVLGNRSIDIRYRDQYLDEHTRGATIVLVNIPFRVAARPVLLNQTVVSEGELGDITFTFKVYDTNTRGVIPKELDRMSIKPDGELLGEFNTNETGMFTVNITATDGGGETFQLESILLDVRRLDVDNPSLGPNSKGCANMGVPVDESGNQFDGIFTSCNCDGLARYVGENCEDQCTIDEMKDSATGKCVDLPCGFTGTCSLDFTYSGGAGARRHLSQNIGVTTVDPTHMSAAKRYRVGTTYRIAPLEIKVESSYTYSLVDAPDRFYINPNTGVVLATFGVDDITTNVSKGGTGSQAPLNVTLQVIADTGDRRAEIETYTMHIEDSYHFDLVLDNQLTDAKYQHEYLHIGQGGEPSLVLVDKPFRVAAWAVDQNKTILSGGTFDDITYTFRVLDAKTWGTIAKEPDKVSIKSNGEILGEFSADEIGEFALIITVTDGNGGTFVLEPILLDVRQLDIKVPNFGPNNKGCENLGVPVDKSGDEFDGIFTSCDCTGIALYVGQNCDELCEIDARKDTSGHCVSISTVIQSDSATDSATSTILAVVVGALVLLMLLIAGAVRYHNFRRSMRPIDFDKLNQKLLKNGTVADAQLFSDRKPRELKRSDVVLLEQVGSGAFGAVWKAMLNESRATGRPEYQVAAKTILDNGRTDTISAATEELTTEAAVMAQLEGHRNLVSIIGVVTAGTPMILVLAYCDHGSMLNHLANRAAEGNAVPAVHKIDFGIQTARGMEHLSQRRFIHRDLASRNVLLTSGQSVSNLVCKIADFGLSRAGDRSDDNTCEDQDSREDYYKSQCCNFPVRWTAPEAMEQLKFTHASDVWSFGIVIIEIIQDGAKPFSEMKSNLGVIRHTISGGVHPKPLECEADSVMADLYNVACECFDFSPAVRPSFTELASGLEERMRLTFGRDEGDDPEDVARFASVASTYQYSEVVEDLLLQESRSPSQVASDAPPTPTESASLPRSPETPSSRLARPVSATDLEEAIVAVLLPKPAQASGEASRSSPPRQLRNRVRSEIPYSSESSGWLFQSPLMLQPNATSKLQPQGPSTKNNPNGEDAIRNRLSVASTIETTVGATPDSELSESSYKFGDTAIDALARLGAAPSMVCGTLDSEPSESPYKFGDTTIGALARLGAAPSRVCGSFDEVVPAVAMVLLRGSSTGYSMGATRALEATESPYDFGNTVHGPAGYKIMDRFNSFEETSFVSVCTEAAAPPSNNLAVTRRTDLSVNLRSISTASKSGQHTTSDAIKKNLSKYEAKRTWRKRHGTVKLQLQDRHADDVTLI
jgi:serine/threonine protein kinase